MKIIIAPKKRTRADTLLHLREQIQRLEGFKPIYDTGRITFGIPDMDESLPNSCFPLGAIHEFISDTAEDAAASCGFVAALLSLICQKQPIIWIAKSSTIFPPGLLSFGIQPDQIVFIELARDKEALWAAEDALRSKGIGAVICEVADADLTATRRMQLAVEDSGVTGFLMRHNPKKTRFSSCVTSWYIRSIPSHTEAGLPGIGHPGWDAELQKTRNGTPGRWRLAWQDSQFKKMNPGSDFSSLSHPLIALAR